MTTCVDDVALWMQSNRLQLNTAKTEVLWCSSARRLHQIPMVPLSIGSNDVIPVSTVRDLGIYIYIYSELHWLSYPERIAYRLAVLAFRCQHSLAPSYLSDELLRASHVDSRRRLRSASTAVLVVPRSKHSTIGDRAFPVAAAKIWNTLPADVTSAPSLPSFKRRWKTELFKRCYASDSANI